MKRKRLYVLLYTVTRVYTVHYPEAVFGTGNV